MFEPEYYYDVLWYTDKQVTVAFSCAVDEVINNPGRIMTFATIMINNKSTGEIITRTGIAICNPKDTFDYVKGRRIATERAIATYPYKCQRKLLWDWYWKSVENAKSREN